MPKRRVKAVNWLSLKLKNFWITTQIKKIYISQNYSNEIFRNKFTLITKINI